MKSRLKGSALFALVLLSASLFAPGAAFAPAQQAATAAAPATEDAAWRQELAAWRAQRERDLAAPDGWLTLVGLEWLKSGVNSVGAAADNQIKLPASSPDQAPAHLGLLTVSGKSPGTQTIQLLSPAGGFPPELKIDGKPAREGSLTVEGANPSTITWRGLTMVVLERGGRYALRIKDANSPTRTGFQGLNWYQPDPRFLIKARWIPFVPAHIEKIPTIIGTTLDLPAPGVAEFTLDGKTLRLEPVIEDPGDKTLFFILRDETSKTTTYQAARFLDTEWPDHGLDQPGELLLDFNRLRNPPCAYTPYATCPLPPDQNRLPVALEAGERRYAH
jgi:uncharacterized protein (DUF1684 family)